MGAGIVGLAVARELLLREPTWEVLVVEKEAEIAQHQTGHNSGVIHAGIYYEPGSVKATLCRRGVGLMKRFCDEHAIEYRELGKLVVALDHSESSRLLAIYARARQNGIVDVEMLGPSELQRIEPHVKAVAALHSPSTAVVDFGAVARALHDDARELGAEIRCFSPVADIRQDDTEIRLRISSEELVVDHVIVCAGLHSSRVARMVGDDDDPRIIPFRGEYHILRQPSADLVRGLVYPVPDPRYPFLGIHLTRHHDDAVDVGPNAVLALALEGYRRRDVSLDDLRDIVSWPGFRRLARRHWRTGASEAFGSLSRRHCVTQARRYIPDLATDDFNRAASGVRAQAIGRDGSMVDDFRISTRGRATLVRNAPSPAATSSLAIAEHIATMVPRTVSR